MKKNLAILSCSFLALGVFFGSQFAKKSDTLTVTSYEANVRSGYDTSHPVVSVVWKNQLLKSIGYQYDHQNRLWYEILLNSGKKAWISSSVASKISPQPVQKSTPQPSVKLPAQPLNVPLISQMPELPRGCEVTSLSMLLASAEINVSKVTLASQVKKDPTPYSNSGGNIYFGNPNNGFVGDMYTFSNPGYGVYHGPIKQLADKYLPGRVVDLTGSSFESIYNYLDKGKPVWVINNVLFDSVPNQYWQTWNTPFGKVSITYKEHSVLVTGHDANFIYFNDPLANIKNLKIPIENFKRGWEQMGSQAISYN